MKLQQAFLEIDENSIDGKALNEQDFSLLADLPRHKLDRNQRLFEIATKALSKCNGNIADFEIEQMSIESDDLVATQEDVNKGDEEIDGIEIIDTSDDIFKMHQGEGEYFSAEINLSQLKEILRNAR